jgi:hypothetical protein
MNRWRGVLAAAWLVAAGGAGTAYPVVAQTTLGAEGWDSPRALELIERARARRLLPQQDTTLRNYSARAEGFVYFYLDRRDDETRTLVKVDQVALEVFWAPPNRTKQRIVGLRDVSRFPNKMNYHLDHLTVVQDGFGDVIRMGDGDEVGDVPHPAAAGSDSIYQFRLTDSLTLRLPGAPEPIRVYEIEVRPRRVDRSALIGSVFVDRAGGDIVRMTFTFTPVSYVDRRLDYISVSLDNGLWEGRYWLPHEQTLQIRRQVPELDFAAGAVIHGRMRVGEYVFNDSLPDPLFQGWPVTAVPPAQRQRFDFERGIYDDLNELGLAPPADLAYVRQQAAALLGTDRLSGLPTVRLNLASASSAFRYNRAEGVTVGAGIAYVPGPTWRADISAGYAFGAGRPWGTLGYNRGVGRAGDLRLRLHHNDVRDVGHAAAVPAGVNTLAALFLGKDYLDPYFSSGATLSIRSRFNRRLHGTAEIGLEQHRSASLTQTSAPLSESAEFRPVRRIDEGELGTMTLGLHRTAPDPRSASWSGAAVVESGLFEGVGYVRPTLELHARRATADHAHSLQLRASAGALIGSAPAQRLHVLGGYGTLPGYDYRSFAGTRFALLETEATIGLLRPWLGARLLGAAATTAGLAPEVRDCPPGDACTGPGFRTRSHWQVRPTDGFRYSAGIGASLLWDLLRIDAVRGLNGGDWQLQISFHRDFWDIS